MILKSVYGDDHLHKPQLFSELYKIVSQDGSTLPISAVSNLLQSMGGNQGSSSQRSQLMVAPSSPVENSQSGVPINQSQFQMQSIMAIMPAKLISSAEDLRSI